MILSALEVVRAKLIEIKLHAVKSLFLDDFLFGSLGSADEDDFAMSLGNMASYPGSTTEPLFQGGKT